MPSLHAQPSLQGPFLQTLHRWSPDQILALGTIGLLLVFLEFNRPGRVYAGSLGLLFTLIAVAALLGRNIRAIPVGCLALAAAIFLLNLYRTVPTALLAISTVGVSVALRCLMRPGAGVQVHTLTALLCGICLGVSAAVLTRIAHRARRAKALN